MPLITDSASTHSSHSPLVALAPSPSSLGLELCTIVAALTVHAALLAYLAATCSPTVDEVGHLPAGLYTWEFGRFDLFRVNPPLVRAVAALPVWLAEPTYDWAGYRAGGTIRPEWNLGRDFIKANGEQSFGYFTWARWMLIPLSLGGGVVCLLWARDLYGRTAGLAALMLWCFSPTVLAYGALITPDLGAAAIGVTAGYAFWRWLRRPTPARAFLAGLALGLALLTKTTWIILFPLWPALWLLWTLTERRASLNVGALSTSAGSHHSPLSPPPTLRMRALQLFAILCLGLYVLNLGYGFDGTFERLGSYRFVSRALSGQAQSAAEAASGANRFSDTWLAEVPLPVPRDFLSGLDIQRREFEQGKWSYLRGEWKHGGWWWYYLYAAMIKEPLGTWLLIAIAVIAAWRNPAEEQSARDTLILLAPGLLVLLLVSSQTGFNRYLRYALPAFPFFFIWASQAVRLAASAPRRWSLPVAAALLWSVASSLWIYPHSLSYFNEAVGGPSGGHRHLIDANIDWGQDLYRLRDWLQAHPDRVPLRAACQAFVPLDQLGVTFGQVPASPESGWFIISRHDRHRRDGAFAYFELIEPVDRIGESMDVYHITEDAAEKIRRAIESASR